MTWDEAAIKRLSDLWATGAPASMIAREMGSTRSAILGKVRRLGLPRPPKPPKPPKSPKPETRISAPTPAIRAPEKTTRAWRVTTYDVDVVGDPAMVGRPMIGAPYDACRWPIDGGLPRLCCSAPVDGKRPYCAAHARVAYTGHRGRLERPRHMIGKRDTWS